eukprot:6492061-Amphidinium_carterae.1
MENFIKLYEQHGLTSGMLGPEGVASIHATCKKVWSIFEKLCVGKDLSQHVPSVVGWLAAASLCVEQSVFKVSGLVLQAGLEVQGCLEGVDVEEGVPIPHQHLLSLRRSNQKLHHSLLELGSSTTEKDLVRAAGCYFYKLKQRSSDELKKHGQKLKTQAEESVTGALDDLQKLLAPANEWKGKRHSATLVELLGVAQNGILQVEPSQIKASRKALEEVHWHQTGTKGKKHIAQLRD